MERVPKKNVSFTMHDIKTGKEELSSQDGKTLKEVEAQEKKVVSTIFKDGAKDPKDTPKASVNIVHEATSASSRVHVRRGMRKFIIAFVIVAILAGVGVVSLKAYLLRVRLSNSVVSGLGYFEQGLSDLKNLDTESATKNFSALDELSRAPDLNSAFTNMWALLKDGGQAIKNFQSLTGGALTLVKELSYLEENWLRAVLGGDGNDFVASFERVKTTLGEMKIQNQELIVANTKFKRSTPVDISVNLPIQLDFGRLEDFLGALIGWLKDPAPRHIAVLFENPSEIRPGGGFVGSYADITVQGGNIGNIEVHDINDPDKLLDVKVTPPKPLQLIATRWRAADANWFFDFPSSAAKVTEFLEASELYRASSTVFDGAIGISARMVGDLLARTGPVELPVSKLTLNQDNFLLEIQKKIELSREKKAKQPKEILGEFMDVMREKLIAFDEAKRKELLVLIQQWFEKKELVFYFENEGMRSYLSYYGLTGEVAKLPADFNGDYLAVVNANIDGGKSDLFIRQSVVFQSQLDESGRVDNHLTVTRSHRGKEGVYWWYTQPNQDYMQVFTGPGMQLENLSGAVQKKIVPKVNYIKEGYLIDPLVKDIESTESDFLSFSTAKSYVAFGKNVFALWSRTPVGTTTTVAIDYSHRLVTLPIEGHPYEFIFEKQRGAKSSYEFQINAPVGYRWKENRLPVYTYTSDDPPGRLVVTLILEKIQLK